MEIVVLMLYESPVAQVPALNFKTFVPEKIPDLKTEIIEGDTHRWKFYTYSVPLFSKRAVERWASWLEHRDLRAIVGLRNILHAMLLAGRLDDTDYMDSLADAWILWLQNGQLAGNLSIGRLRSQSWLPGHLYDLKFALILHHDAYAVTAEDSKGEVLPYNKIVRERVRKLASNYFFQPEKEPKDPLQLANDDFCKKYHFHHKKNLPCYKTKRLPEKA